MSLHLLKCHIVEITCHGSNMLFAFLYSVIKCELVWHQALVALKSGFFFLLKKETYAAQFYNEYSGVKYVILM